MASKYILETKSPSEWQKQLNQWNHNYEIEIKSMLNLNPNNEKITILLLRTEKGDK